MAEAAEVAEAKEKCDCNKRLMELEKRFRKVEDRLGLLLKFLDSASEEFDDFMGRLMGNR